MLHAALRATCCEANRRLASLGIVELTFGTVSVADRSAGVVAIKPSGVAYDRLAPADMVVLSLAADAEPDGSFDLERWRIDGDRRPSSDSPTHLHLYRAFPGANAVVHTHSRHAVAFAQAGRPIPRLGTTHADYFRGPVPVTRRLDERETAGAYEWETGRLIAETFAGIDPAEVPAILVNGHGPFVWGPDAAHAVETAHALEIIAQMALATLTIAPEVPSLPECVGERHFRRKHGPGAYYGQRS